MEDADNGNLGGGVRVNAGLWLLVMGILLVGFAYILFKRAESKLLTLKQEDLVSYYLELALRLLPFPFCSLFLGALFIMAALLVLIVDFSRGLLS